MFQPLFTGQLVRLAAPQPDDRAILADWTQDDEYMRLLDDDPVRPQAAKDMTWLDNPNSHDSYYFHIRTLTDNKLIGFVVLHSIKWASQTSELAIGIGERDYWGRGYGKDALRLVLNYAFSELNLYRIGLNVLGYNARAIKAYEQLGFVHEGAKRGMVLRGGERHDLIFYGLLRDEWAVAQG